MQFPCEIIVKNILPAIRAIMVKELNEKYNKSQKEIAELLGITQPSVSYYLHGERGERAINVIRETKKTHDKILELLENLVTGNMTCNCLLKELCTICLEIRPIYLQKVCPEKFEFMKDWNVCFMEK